MAKSDRSAGGDGALGGPELRRGQWVWSGRGAGVEVRFAGRGTGRGPQEVLARVGGDGVRAAWARQVHSARVLTASAGACGEGDALVTDRRGLALSVATADCVPVLLAGDGIAAAVHAGWRGIAAGVIDAALDRVGGDPAALAAWIGPAIGPCCYEVGEEVARRVAARSAASVVRPGASRRPHLDLPAAVTLQLQRRGVRRIRAVAACTRCQEAQLWSYRRAGRGSGRNYAFIWRPGSGA